MIISCAVTGAIHTPSMSPYLPITPQAIADAAVEAGEAGAAIVHLHARDPIDGSPSPDPGLFREFVTDIKQRSDVVINITTGGGLGMSIEERLAAAITLKPELASLNMGSINFGIFRAAQSTREFKFDWEKPYLEATKDFILSNTFSQIEYVVKSLQGDGCRFEFECYDLGHLYNLAYFLEEGIVEPPLFIQGVFGVLGGLNGDPQNLFAMRDLATRLFGDDFLFSTLGAGKAQMQLGVINAALGGHVRVGLEDSLYLERGKFAVTNAEQVNKIIRIASELSLAPVTSNNARDMLYLKGASNVAF